MSAHEMAAALAKRVSPSTRECQGGRDAGLACTGAKVARITRADIAAATAGALSQGGHAGKVYDLTGPEALSLFELRFVLTQAWGKDQGGKYKG